MFLIYVLLQRVSKLGVASFFHICPISNACQIIKEFLCLIVDLGEIKINRTNTREKAFSSIRLSVVDKTRLPATSKNLTLSPSANHACRIWPNFTDFWKPCFIHYYILALNLIKIKIKIKNKTKNQSKIYISLFKSDSFLFGVIPSRKDRSFPLLKSESLFLIFFFIFLKLFISNYLYFSINLNFLLFFLYLFHY